MVLLLLWPLGLNGVAGCRRCRCRCCRCCRCLFRPWGLTHACLLPSCSMLLLTSLLCSSTDPLSVPPRREQCSRKAKSQSSMHAAMLLNSTSVTGETGIVNEPDEFTDSDTDPVWTPQEEDVSVEPPWSSHPCLTSPHHTSPHLSRRAMMPARAMGSASWLLAA